MTADELDFMPVDMSAMRDWPELRARALDDFAHRAGREAELKQVDAERQLVALARNLPASDCCPECQGDPCAPIVVEPDPARGGIIASYRCEHGHHWQTGWAPRHALVEYFG